MTVQKKFFSVFISFVLAVGLVPTAAFALPADLVANQAASLPVSDAAVEDSLAEGENTSVEANNTPETVDSEQNTGDGAANGSEAVVTDKDDISSSEEAMEIATQSEGASSEEVGLEAQASGDPVITATMHVQTYGDRSPVQGGTSVENIIGTTGQSKRVEALSLAVSGVSGLDITYEAHVQDIGWQGWKSDGAKAGTTGQSKRLEALRIKLTGAAASNYDVYYRVHAQDYGWMAWTSNGACAGTSGQSKRLEAVQVTIVPAGSGAPSSYAPAQADSSAYRTAWGTGVLGGQAHVQDYGWMSQVDCSSSRYIGTMGKSKRMEAFVLKLDSSVSGSIQYKAHVQSVGWQGWKTSGQTAGTTGRGLRVEATQVQLTGEAASLYDVYYRAHVQKFGWLGWAKNGETAGTTSMSYRVEAFEVMLVPKGSTPPESSARPFVRGVSNNEGGGLESIGFVHSKGEQEPVGAGKVIGTTGKGLALEGFLTRLTNTHADALQGGLLYRLHVSDVGWTEWTSEAALKANVNLYEQRKIQAVEIKLTGEIASYYNVYYRAHIANQGWLGWAVNGEVAGSQGLGIDLQALQIELRSTAMSAPGSRSQHEYKCLKYSDWLNSLRSASGSGSVKVFGPGASLPAAQYSRIKSAINNFTSHGRRVGFVMMDLNSGQGVSYNADSGFFGASTIKGPYVLSLNQYAPGTKNSSSGEMYRAITYSDNNAYTSLRNRYGGLTMQTLFNSAGIGYKNGNEVWPSYTPRELSMMWAASYNYLGGDAQGKNSAYMRDLLDSPAHSPIHDCLHGSYRTYSKSGWMYDYMWSGGIFNDAGVVVTPSGPYLVAIMSSANAEDYWLMNDLVYALDAAHSSM